jgi:hypothetical protein
MPHPLLPPNAVDGAPEVPLILLVPRRNACVRHGGRCDHIEAQERPGVAPHLSGSQRSREHDTLGVQRSRAQTRRFSRGLCPNASHLEGGISAERPCAECIAEPSYITWIAKDKDL